MSIKIAVAGAAGRMGRALIRAALAGDALQVVGGTERAGAGELGADLGALVGQAPLGVITMESAASAASGADLWIDFTMPAATLGALDALVETNIRAAVIGTTGFSEAEEQKLAVHAKRLAMVRSGNFSLGVNLLAALAEQAARRLGKGWDVEIVEAHHRRKVDAPSGTALLLGEAVAAGRNQQLSALRLPPHDGVTGARPEGGIGFAVLRGGGVVGEHDVVFAAEREIVTLSHQALDRAVFADGALAAARWAADKPPGLYSMRDVLGF